MRAMAAASVRVAGRACIVRERSTARPRLPAFGFEDHRPQREPQMCYAPPMTLASWSFPTTIIFGEGALSTLPDHVRCIGGRRVLIVGDPGVVKAGLLERVTEALGTIPHVAFDRVDPNPVEKNVFDGVA